MVHKFHHYIATHFDIMELIAASMINLRIPNICCNILQQKSFLLGMKLAILILTIPSNITRMLVLLKEPCLRPFKCK